jgi:glycosyltransferase involved in cell wall biosynthesis
MPSTKPNSTVSIVTITQLSRSKCLFNLYDLIRSQTYTNILEWVIVEGSRNEIDGEQNRINIQYLQDNHTLDFKIVYVPYSNQKLSDLRNLSNDACKGDIIVCMDDDDYYPKERVKHAVEQLEKSEYLLAGCTDVYLYDYGLEKMYKCTGFHSYHSTNNVLAYKREYLINHRYAPGLSMGEEAGFTNYFTEPMVQLHAKKSIVVSCHTSNTVDKRPFCTQSIVVNEIKNDVHKYIPMDIFHRMRDLFSQSISP